MVRGCHGALHGARQAHRVLVVAVVALLLAGCQFRVATDIVVETDGSGTATLRVVVDEELAAALEDADVDLREGLDEAAAGADWEAVAVDGDDGTGVELRTSFAEPEELGDRVAALSASLTDQDGALLQDVRLELTEDGGYEFTATAGIDPPRIVGSLPLEGDGARFDGDDLARALEEGGDEVARHDLRVTFPTVPTADDGTIDTTSVTWQLPNSELRTVAAAAPPLPVDRSQVLLVAAGIGAAIVVAFAVRMLRRRR